MRECRVISSTDKYSYFSNTIFRKLSPPYNIYPSVKQRLLAPRSLDPKVIFIQPLKTTILSTYNYAIEWRVDEIKTNFGRQIAHGAWYSTTIEL